MYYVIYVYKIYYMYYMVYIYIKDIYISVIPGLGVEYVLH